MKYTIQVSNFVCFIFFFLERTVELSSSHWGPAIRSYHQAIQTIEPTQIGDTTTIRSILHGLPLYQREFLNDPTTVKPCTLIH